MTYREAIEAQEQSGGLWDDTGDMGSSESQEVMDIAHHRHAGEWTGSPSDWRLLYEIADEMDARE